MLRNSVINLTLKVGLAISLFYSALASFVISDDVVARWPSFISRLMNEQVLAWLTGFTSLFFMAWLFSGRKKFSAAVTVGVAIGLAAIANITDVPYLFSTAPLVFVCFALALRYYPRIRIVTQTKVTPLTKTIVRDSGEPEYAPAEGDDIESSLDDEAIVESDIHREHDQHLFITKK